MVPINKKAPDFGQWRNYKTWIRSSAVHPKNAIQTTVNPSANRSPIGGERSVGGVGMVPCKRVFPDVASW